MIFNNRARFKNPLWHQFWYFQKILIHPEDTMSSFMGGSPNVQIKYKLQKYLAGNAILIRKAFKYLINLLKNQQN